MLESGIPPYLFFYGDTDLDSSIEDIPLDGKLLGEAIIELNISRHNVSIYPKNHPVVETSLDRSYNFLLRLFELRQEVTIAIAKDTIVVDDYALDKKNPVFKDFALCLNFMNIASVKFIGGVTKNELYSFHSFLSQHKETNSPKELQTQFEAYGLIHITVRFINYSEFNLVQGVNGLGERDVPLWEKYICGLLNGNLQSEDAADSLYEATHEELARFINNIPDNAFKKDSYEKVITSYVKKSSERAFSGEHLKRLFDFISELRPEIKRQFLSCAVNTVSEDPNALQHALMEMSADNIVTLLRIINEQLFIIPEALKNVLDKFSTIKRNNCEPTRLEEGLVEDDILLSPEMTTLLSNANFKAFVSDEYQKEIQYLLQYHSQVTDSEWITDYDNQLNDTYIDNLFHQTILELMSSESPDIIPEDEMESIEKSIKEQLQHFVETAQYKNIHETFTLFESNMNNQHTQGLIKKILEHCYSPEFLVSLVNSFRIAGKQMREEAFLLCEYYGEKIAAPLIEALINEDTQSRRRFLLSLITYLGNRATEETLRHLNDNRWYVQRNMLFILYECGDEEALGKARPYCRHKNSKVKFEAIKCLLAAKDSYGLTALRENLKSDSKENVRKAIDLVGVFRLNEMVPDLVALINKRAITGADFEDKIPIAKALGQIGGSEAIKALHKILSTKTILFKSSLEKLKNEIRDVLIKSKEGFDEGMNRNVIERERSATQDGVPTL